MRRSITLMVTAGLLPIVALSGAFGFLTLRAQHAAVFTGTSAAAKFSAALAETKLGDGMRAVNMIAQSPAFDAALDIDRFRTLALRLKDGESAWRTLSVANPAGRRLIDVPAPIGIPGGPVVDQPSLDRAVRTRRPVVGNVVAGPNGRYAFAIRAPVIRGGEVRYVVSAVIAAETVRPLLLFHNLPDGWRAAIVDGSGSLVASSSPFSPSVGRHVSLPGLQSRRSGRPSFYAFRRGDGMSAVGTWSPIAGTDWSVHVSAPATQYSVPARQALALLIVVALLCLVLLVIFVRLLSIEMRQTRDRQLAEVQSQRLEALGRLTGGVAHDLNNLLTPIVGGLDLLRRRVGDDPRALRHVDAAAASADRARSLVARLLSFARRQTLSAQDLEVGPLLDDLHDLLVRTLGPSIAVEIDVVDGLPPLHADRGQLELAILNLAINARDAMPAGGAVTIRAAPASDPAAAGLPQGDYIAISVADAGMGMDDRTLRQATEPFFTTKPVGEGTGLGLSMVHGFAGQSGGALQLASTLGQGTVATIILPRGGQPLAAAEAADGDTTPSRCMRLLLVDDEEMVRQSTADMLREIGYAVVEAPSVQSARTIMRERGPFDAILTDYLMPGETGADLVREVRAQFSDMPIILLTGYADGATDVDPAIPRLAKPFRLAELAEKLAFLSR